MNDGKPRGSVQGDGRRRSSRAARIVAAGVAAGLIASTFASGLAPSPRASATPASAVAAQPADQGAPFTARVKSLLAKMTLNEKIAFIHGATEAAATDQGQAGYLPGIARLGIPSLRLADGPPGVLTQNDSTGLTDTIGVAATFSRTDAQANGVVIGRDDQALGVDVSLQPFINLDRDLAGRGWNTFGEDPLLTGLIGASEVTGIQSQGTMAEAKHYIAYDGASNVNVDQQTLHEIYLQPFEDVIDAGVASIMCSYNKVNGPQSCGNADTLTTILRGELGYKGFVVSDWGANHDTTFATDGLDLEMPGISGFGGFITAHFTQSALTKALQTGQVSEGVIDQAVARILYQYQRFGLLDGKSKHNVTSEPILADAQVVQKTGADGAVLLKNSGNALPLTSSDLTSLAMIGPGAGQIAAVGMCGEGACGIPSRFVSPLDALKKIAGTAANVTFAVGSDLTGTPIPASAFSHDGKPGLLRTDSKTHAKQIDAQVNYTTSAGSALPTGTSYTWTGTLNIPVTGEYSLNLGILGAFGTLTVDGQSAESAQPFPMHGKYLKAAAGSVLPTTDNLDSIHSMVGLKAGAHKVSFVETGDASGHPVQVRLSWVTLAQQQANYAAAVAAAKASKMAVVFAWSINPYGPLPENQDKLIEGVAAANPNTIVVLNTAQPVEMPWLSKVKAVVEMWFPGQEGGWSTANILLGKANPAGRLPMTWPAKASQIVSDDLAHPERSDAGVGCTVCSGFSTNGTTTYSEGIFMGYRGYDKQNLQPLFPFGYGLSYTTFAYSSLSVRAAADKGLDVSFTVRNSGKVKGDEVPQVYVGAPAKQPAGAQFAVKSLAAFDRVSLDAGQAKTVTLHVPFRQLQYWSTADNGWETAAGARPLNVGSSSRSIVLSTTVKVAGH
jgi:beta-glucosidase